MAQYEVKRGWVYVAPNGVTYNPGQIVEIDETKMTPGENLQKPTKKALDAAVPVPPDEPPLFPPQT
jgi:hypothetical protein